MTKKFTAVEGDKYAIEWYFDLRGRSDPLEYFQGLSDARKKKALYLMKLVADRGKVFNKELFNFEKDKIFAIKPAPDRFLCFFYTGAKLIITNAYEKKTQKMPSREKERASKAREDYMMRCNKGTYYE